MSIFDEVTVVIAVSYLVGLITGAVLALWRTD